MYNWPTNWTEEKSRVSSRQEEEASFSPHNFPTGSGAYAVCYCMGTLGSIHGLYQLGPKTHHLILSSSSVYLHGAHRDNYF
jgi:hypothetical protein